MGILKAVIAPMLVLTIVAGCAAPTTKTVQGSKAVVAYEEEKQRELVVKSAFDAVGRLDRLSWPIRLANADMCDLDHKRFLYGFTPGSIQIFDKKFQLAAQNALGIDAAIRVQRVNPGSPAEIVGFEPGDRIIGIDGEPVTAKFLSEMMKKMSEKPRAIVTVSRDGVTDGPVDVAINGVLGCSYQVLYSDGQALNAMADGERIIITRGMERFARNDDELSLVIAHEFAHNIMEHSSKKKQNAVAGTFAGLALDLLAASQGVNLGATRAFGSAGAQMHTVEFEQEADYVAMYLLARAGKPTASVADFWRRMAAEHPQGIDKRSTHPSKAERFVALEMTHKEVQAKIQAGAPLLPNMKEEVDPYTGTASSGSDGAAPVMKPGQHR